MKAGQKVQVIFKEGNAEFTMEVLKNSNESLDMRVIEDQRQDFDLYSGIDTEGYVSIPLFYLEDICTINRI